MKVSKFVWYLLSAAALMLLSICLCVPIYADELAWHLYLGRVFDDGLVGIKQLPQCGGDLEVKIPLTLVPGRTLFSFVFYQISPPYLLRALGVLVSLCFCLCSLFFLQTFGKQYWGNEGKRENLNLARVLFIAAFTLGVAPAAWSLARPEGLFSFALIISSLLVFRFSREVTRVAGLFFYGLSALCVFALHPKGLFFLPLLLVGAGLIKVRRSALLKKLAASGLIVVGAAQSVWYNSQIYACPDAPHVAQDIASHMVKPTMLMSAPLEYFSKISQNLLSIERYAQALVVPKASVFWGWLPPHDFGSLDTYWAYMVRGTFWGLCAVIMVGWCFGAVRAVKSRTLSREFLWASCLLFCHFGLMAHQTKAHPYDGSFNIALLGLEAALCSFFIKFKASGIKQGLYYVTSASVLSGIILFGAAYSSLVERMYTLSVQGEFPHPFHSGIQLFNYEMLEQELSAAADICGMNSSNLKGVVVDDASYFMLQRSPRVMHTMGLIWWGQPGQDKYQLFKDSGLRAILTRCHSLSPELVAKSSQNNGYCCLEIE